MVGKSRPDMGNSKLARGQKVGASSRARLKASETKSKLCLWQKGSRVQIIWLSIVT